MDSNNFNDYLYIKYVKRKILIFNKLYLIILYLENMNLILVPPQQRFRCCKYKVYDKYSLIFL